MKSQDSSFVLEDVPNFSQEYPDVFADALANALCFGDEGVYERCGLLRAYRLTRGHREGVYSAISTLTGRAWLFGVDEASFNLPDPDVRLPFPGTVSGLEAFFEHPETLWDAFRFVDRLPELLWNQDCACLVDEDRAAGFMTGAQKVGRQELRRYVTRTLAERRHPILGLLQFPDAPFADIALFTGYESGGEVILGRSPYADPQMDATGPYGYFRLADWESETLAVIGLGEEQPYEWEYQPAYAAMANALRYATSDTQGAWQSGLNAYDAWERLLLDEESYAHADDSLLSRRLLLHSMIAGYLASQKAFTVLPDCRAPTMGVVEGLYYRAKAGPGLIHGLMWDAWQVAGGYWRGVKTGESRYTIIWKNDDELRRFRERSVRERAARVVCRARQVDAQAIQDLTEAKEEWDHCLGRGKDHPCPCWDQPCARV